MTRISIAMATYNGAAFLREQLDSFAVQSRLPHEVIVTDDCSTDATVLIVEDFARKAPFEVILSRNPTNLGYSRNFENAVRKASGDIIFISDQDDVWFPNKIATVAELFEGKNAPLVVVNDQILALDGISPSGVTIFENSRKFGFPDSTLIAGCCTAISKSLRAILVPFPESMPYDSWVGKMGDFLGSKTLVEEPLQIYRRHGGNTTNSVLAILSPSKLTMFRRFGIRDPRPAWREEIDLKGLFEARIRQHEDSLRKIIGPKRVDDAFSRLSLERQWTMDRLKLLSSPRYRRLPLIYARWRDGFYKNQFGILSAIKDVVRR